jgi:hypothetical protein
VRSVIVSPYGVLGWWDGSRWIGQPDGGAVPVRGGETYLVVGTDQPVTETTGSAPTETCAISDYRIQDVELDPEAFQSAFPRPIAVSGVTSPQPRPLIRLPVSTPAYVDAARAVLRDLGLDVATPRLVGVIQVDLDGDGVNEVLVVAEQVAQPGPVFGRSATTPWSSSVAPSTARRTTVLWTSIVTASSDPLFEPGAHFIDVASTPRSPT